MSSQTVFEQYANAGLVPLNARPNTYPYNFIVNPHLSSKPRTPTLTLISEQKERETVSITVICFLLLFFVIFFPTLTSFNHS